MPEERHLLIDDMRNIRADRVARTFEAGIKALEEEIWDVLWLDHDLGQEDGKDGTGIMNWLEAHPDRLPKRIVCVSSNPVGRDRITKISRRLLKKRGV